MELQARHWSEAVANLQHALRGYSSDGSSWEALGVAYQQLGMFTAALKAYGRAVALQEASPVFALLQSGNILLSLASFTQASEMFHSALDKAPQHVVAQCGLGTALLGRARECISTGAFAWAATLLEEASQVVSHCTTSNGRVAAAWKLLGDIEVTYAQILPCEVIEAGVEAVGMGDVSATVTAYAHKRIKAWCQQRVAAAKRAMRAYLHLLHLCPDQGSVFADCAIAMELVSSLQRDKTASSPAWSGPEKAMLGGLRLDGTNADMWVTFGILVQPKALKQHAFIQALRLDAYHALTWAHLGQLYLCKGEQELAKQAFDRARSADATLALPWSGMALVHSMRGSKQDMEEAMASCLQAVHLSPVVNFQLGLAKLANCTHQLHLPQVYAAIEQAVQHAPQMAEAHNLKGLVCECQGNFSAAIAAFKMAGFMLASTAGVDHLSLANKSNMVSLNLARVLCKVGNTRAAIQEYAQLAGSGILLSEPEALQSYAVAVWESGDRQLATAVAEQANESRKEATSLSLYFKMKYWDSGPSAVLEEIRKTEIRMFKVDSFSFTAFALAVASGHQQSVSGVLSRRNLLFEHERGPQAHLLLAAGKQINQVAERHHHGGVVGSLLIALHSFPNSFRLRAKLGQVLTESSYGNLAKLAVRCCNVHLYPTVVQDVVCTSSTCAVVACSVCGNVQPDFYFSPDHQRDAAIPVRTLVQRWVHTQPWNSRAQYSLILTLQQQMQQQKQVCQMIYRMACNQFAAIASDPVMGSILQVCASDAALRLGDTASALQHAKAASELSTSNLLYHLFASFQLARCYAATENHQLLHMELKKCHRNTSSDDLLGLLKLAELEDQAGSRDLRSDSFEHAVQMKGGVDQGLWMALWWLGHAQTFLEAQDYLSAEKAAAKAVTFHSGNPILHLFHGAICIELAKVGGHQQYLSLAIHSLQKAVQNSASAGLAVADALLAQTEASKATSHSRTPLKWEKNLHMAWARWPAEHRPAELYFQMGSLSEQSRDTTQEGMQAPETLRSKQSWLQTAVRSNPACLRYWRTLRQS
ncbi:hypothetical protein BDL97_11G024900 [Sphagnum fallax]|nr:hypothetical protein BDL97_11G024900 [Sphagnum fallax]